MLEKFDIRKNVQKTIWPAVFVNFFPRLNKKGQRKFVKMHKIILLKTEKNGRNFYLNYAL